MITSLMAIALAMDAFTVAVTCGMDGTIRTMGQRIKISLIFGLSQGFLFGLGIILYQILSGEVTKYNSLVAGVILLTLGIHSLFNSFQAQTVERKNFSFGVLCALGIATSIDALAAGITFNLIYENASEAIVIVGLIGTLLTYAGAAFGMKIGHKIGNKANIIGGLVIIMLGIKSLFF